MVDIYWLQGYTGWVLQYLMRADFIVLGEDNSEVLNQFRFYALYFLCDISPYFLLLQLSFFAILLKDIIDNNPRIIPGVLSAVISMERIASLPRNHHMTYTTIIIPGHKDKIEINEAETRWPR